MAGNREEEGSHTFPLFFYLSLCLLCCYFSAVSSTFLFPNIDFFFYLIFNFLCPLAPIAYDLLMQRRQKVNPMLLAFRLSTKLCLSRCYIPWDTKRWLTLWLLTHWRIVHFESFFIMRSLYESNSLALRCFIAVAAISIKVCSHLFKKTVRCTVELDGLLSSGISCLTESLLLTNRRPSTLMETTIPSVSRS